MDCTADSVCQIREGPDGSPEIFSERWTVYVRDGIASETQYDVTCNLR